MTASRSDVELANPPFELLLLLLPPPEPSLSEDKSSLRVSAAESMSS
eukprot:CAMPEP_0117668572 /NCGR_PEP_ID=MMETSP0804-20121206/11626_1 /TAXON_ID=1074897 /ORGANISM="Tetraselmis astigmatica, Strain CCMP880" /LENGTH=46 /DNA_ID= /DNA_START= /DNA_END= /DNA_ORIENTATION=